MNGYSIQITDYLLAQSWQIAVLVVVVAAVTVLLRNRSAHVRYLLWLIVLAKCLVPPFLTVPLAVLPEQGEVITFTPTERMAVEPISTSAVEAPVPPAPVIVKHRPGFTTRQWLVAAWIAGAGMFVLVAMVKALRTEFWLRRERKPLPEGLQSEIKELFSRLGVRISPKLWLVEGIGQPFVWGLLRGGIYLPRNFIRANSTEHRRGIIGHELSHVLRFDAAVNLLQVIAQTLFWFHPLVWWANRKIRAEREKCCDEMTIARLGTKAQDYSDAIVNIVISESESARPIPSLAVAGPVKNIEERIRTMLRPGKKFYKHPSLPAVAIVVLTALLAVPTTVVLTVRAEDHPGTESAEAGQIFIDPVNLGPTVNSSADEFDPSISADGLELYFNSYRPGGLGQADIWVARRKTKTDPWSKPVNLGPTVNSPAGDRAPCISADGLSLYFSSDRSGGYGKRDLWVTRRETTSAPWRMPVNLGSTVNGAMHEHSPSISTNGLTLYFAGRRSDPGSSGGGDIWVTTRKTKRDPWGTPVNLGPIVNSSAWDQAPSISDDGLTLYFDSERSGGSDIWVTTRKKTSDPWGTPIKLSPVVNADWEANPDISRDGSTVYFVSTRDRSGGCELWQVSLRNQGAKE